MTLGEWPFKPKQVSRPISGDDYKKRKNLLKLNQNGIISNDYLKGIITTISNDMGKPISVCEFVYNDNDDIVITNAISINYKDNPACKEFRSLTSGRVCDGCEKFVANLFRGFLVKHDGKDFNQKYSENIKSFDYLLEYKFVKYDKFNIKHDYVEFMCPMLYYRKIAIPIFCDKQVVGVLFIGRILHEDDTTKYDFKQKLFLNQNLNLFEEYCKDRVITTNDCKQNVLECHRTHLQDNSNILKKTEYLQFLDKILTEVAKLEIILKDEVKKRREEYISSKITGYTTYFSRQLLEQKIVEKKRLTHLWTLVEECINDLCNDFAIRHIYIFGSKIFRRDPPLKLELVSKAGKVPKCLENEINIPIIYDLDKIPKRSKRKLTVSTNEPRLFNGLPCDDLDLSEHFVRTFPISKHNIIITWAGYNKSVWSPLTTDSVSGIALDRSVRTFYTMIVSTYSAIIDSFIRDKIEDTIRIYGHEAGQIIPGLDWIRETYLSDPKKLRQLNEDKADDICRDIESFIKQIGLIFEKAKYSVAIPPLSKEKFFPFREILYKWKDVYKIELENKHLELIIKQVRTDDPYRQKIFADKLLLEQMIYNILGNAVKYCYPGTKIYLDCKRETLIPNSPYVFTITDYGVPIPDSADKNRIFRIYKRAHNVESEEGLGIGLSVVSEIVKAHKGTINYTSKRISPFNVTLMSQFLSSGLRSFDTIEYQRVSQWLQRLRYNNFLDRILVSSDANSENAEEDETTLANTINKETHEVIFKISIPNEEN